MRQNRARAARPVTPKACLRHDAGAFRAHPGGRLAPRLEPIWRNAFQPRAIRHPGGNGQGLTFG
jgi:hypothetical protein